MAFTKINFYVGLLFSVAVVTISLLLFGNALVNDSNITLDNNSISYIGNYSANLEATGINDFNDADTVSSLKENNIVTEGNQTEGFSVTDFLANINYYSEKVNQITSWVKVVYNLPSFAISALGLPIEPFRHVINVTGICLFIFILVLLIRLVRGS